jgi:hypothetical protein
VLSHVSDIYYRLSVDYIEALVTHIGSKDLFSLLARICCSPHLDPPHHDSLASRTPARSPSVSTVVSETPS